MNIHNTGCELVSDKNVCLLHIEYSARVVSYDLGQVSSYPYIGTFVKAVLGDARTQYTSHQDLPFPWVSHELGKVIITIR